MSLRFHRSMKLLPGVRLNFGKRGIGISAGVRGLRVGVDSRGKGYTSAGIPGTGLSVRKYARKGDPEAQQYQTAALAVRAKRSRSFHPEIKRYGAIQRYLLSSFVKI